MRCSSNNNVATFIYYACEIDRRRERVRDSKSECIAQKLISDPHTPLKLYEFRQFAVATKSAAAVAAAASATATVAAADRSAEIAINKADPELLLSFFIIVVVAVPLIACTHSKEPQPRWWRQRTGTLANTKPLDPPAPAHPAQARAAWQPFNDFGQLDDTAHSETTSKDTHTHPHTHTHTHRKRQWHNHNEPVRLEHRVATYGCMRQRQAAATAA